MSEAAVEDALEALRPALDADGFDLRLGSIKSNGEVEVILEARPTACLECLLADELIVTVLENAIHDRNSELGKVTLLKVGFEALDAH
jgi:Fe-S cluster biogenesis protein NfuA